jgi:hypothetical protein
MISSALLLLLAAEKLPGLAVMDFAIEGAPPEIAAATSGLVSHELERLQLFKVTTAETTRVILGVERQRALIGCENCSGATLEELTSFEYLVTGKLVRSGGPKESKYVLMLTLMKSGSNSPLSSVRIEAKGEEKLLQEVTPGTLKLVGKLLEGRQGSLVVGSSETGAAVKIDDTQVGTTPLQSRVQIAAGPHLLSVEKEGFTQVRKEVRVSPDQVSDEFVRLVPSPDMAEAYEAKAKRFRVLAWVSTGVAVAGVGAFIGGNLAANSYYGESGVPGTFASYRAELAKGDETNRDKANQLKSQIELMQTVSWIGLGAAAAGGIAATVFFVVGDSPGKYEAYRQKTGVVSMSVSPAPGGMVVSGQF